MMPANPMPIPMACLDFPEIGGLGPHDADALLADLERLIASSPAFGLMVRHFRRRMETLEAASGAAVPPDDLWAHNFTLGAKAALKEVSGFPNKAKAALEARLNQLAESARNAQGDANHGD